MTPVFTTTLTKPERDNELKQAYADGFIAGKASLKKELKHLLKQLGDIKLSETTTTTYTNIK